MQAILNEIADKTNTQRSIARSYARLILTDSIWVSWPTINEAIITRWSWAGLQRVKKLAWEMLKGREITTDECSDYEEGKP